MNTEKPKLNMTKKNAYLLSSVLGVMTLLASGSSLAASAMDERLGGQVNPFLHISGGAFPLKEVGISPIMAESTRFKINDAAKTSPLMVEPKPAFAAYSMPAFAAYSDQIDRNQSVTKKKKKKKKNKRRNRRNRG
ncbi:hypothetical protein SG34_032400 [Thalassomonas viridans]|uniref:Uncharacterized protein n=1 Tax=Thalassomonas viridans TaxID=137584 RepID=A0AAF0CCQ9_9GAMM|nr:hypothetical protein [Thalassomonas viridans]WDE08623.1 hypothetical protein SG34_032400 [Thalassomonas viridans]